MENFIFCTVFLLEDSHMTPESTNLQHFTYSFNLENLIHETACAKGLPSCIDFTITNKKTYFKNTCVTETWISDFHKLTAASLKSEVLKAPVKCKFRRISLFFIGKYLHQCFKHSCSYKE